MESKESMAKRADHFLDHHLLPLLNFDSASREHTVAIVSHGILLSNLWRRLLLRLPRRSLTIAAEVTAARGDIVLEHLGGWSNTGFLQLTIRRDDLTSSDLKDKSTTQDESSNVEADKSSSDPSLIIETTALTANPQKDPDIKSDLPLSSKAKEMLDGYSTRILAIDSKQHLAGLKRQRGGIGRSAHDESQKKLDGFFKKQRTG